MPLTILTVLPFDGAGFNGYGCGCGCGSRCGCSPVWSSGLGDAAPAGDAGAGAAGDAAKQSAPSPAWNAQQWSIFFQTLGGLTKPIFNSLGQLIDLKSGKVLFSADSQTAMLYKQFLEQQKQQQTPTWLWPTLILGVAGVAALMIAKR